MPYVASRSLRRRKGFGALQDLAPDDPILQNPDEGTIPGGQSGGTYPLNTTPRNWGYGQQGCPFFSQPYDGRGGFTVDSSGKQTPGGTGCISIFELYPIPFAIGAGLLGILLLSKAMR